jgi:hypothetical protein
VGVSIPAIRFRSVVFPEPEGPISATKSPSAIERETLFNTGTLNLSRVYDFETLEILIAATITPRLIVNYLIF